MSYLTWSDPCLIIFLCIFVYCHTFLVVCLVYVCTFGPQISMHIGTTTIVQRSKHWQEQDESDCRYKLHMKYRTEEHIENKSQTTA
jgi:hypothetical protein